MRIGILRIPIFLATALYADPIGWGDPILVDRKLEEFAVCCHEGESRLYAVTTALKAPFKKDSPTTIDVALTYSDNGKFVRKVISEITLATADQLFPVHPSVSVLGNEILVAWQESLPSGGSSGIYFAYSAGGPDGFSEKQVLPATAGKLNAILPLAKMTAPRRQIILYQEPSSANRFRLTAATGVDGVFTGLVSVAEISGSTRGALFPAALRRGERVDILYQNRADATLLDDIFRSFSLDGGATWVSGGRITQNNMQNFSPRMTNTKEKLVFVWQSNPKKIWTIFAAPEGSEALQVSENNSPSYLPAIVASNDTIVTAWQDTRAGAPQIFARFLDRPDNPAVGVDHRVTKDGIAARPMEFVRLGTKPFLFYGCGPGLCLREADTSAEAVRVSSRTHAIGKISKSNEAIFNWRAPNEISGIDSYAYVIDDQKETDPDLYNLNARAAQITIPGLNGGAYFMHIKYKDRAGNVSPITHYPFVVDSVPPSKPNITSPTHENGIPDSKQEITLKFLAADDSGIQTYRYAFAEKLPRVFAETTTSEELTLSNVPYGKYVFAVEAVDLGGNVSERAYYRIEIGPNERNDLTIRHNAEADVISRPDITFSIQDNSNRGIKGVYYQSGFDTADPFLGTSVPLETVENVYAARIKNLERGISVISLGIVYADGTRAAPRHFFFDSSDPRAKKNFALSGIDYEKLVIKPERSAIEVGGKTEIISSLFDRGILEIRLNFTPPKKVKIKGFVWEIASAERVPQGEINFSGPVEFVYLQKPGQYHLNAKTLFVGPERKQFAYDSRLIEVPDLRKAFRKNLFTGLAGGVILILLILLWQRKRISFYAGAWT